MRLSDVADVDALPCGPVRAVAAPRSLAVWPGRSSSSRCSPWCSAPLPCVGGSDSARCTGAAVGSGADRGRRADRPVVGLGQQPRHHQRLGLRFQHRPLATSADASIDVSFPNVTEDSSNSVVIILLLTVLSIAPSLLVLCTSFTRIVIVLSLTRNALGIPSIPPQQVIVGLSVFLTLFVMGPTLERDEVGRRSIRCSTARSPPRRRSTRPRCRCASSCWRTPARASCELFLDASDTPTPVARDKVPLNALIPAFVLSELKSGFIIGFVIFVPFLIIDLVVSAVLMGLGMMMLPPSFVSLPFKLLLFVMLDGWMLVVGTLLTSYG